MKTSIEPSAELFLDANQDVSVREYNLTANVGVSSTVIIKKLYGPAAFSPLKITATCEPEWGWNIEMMNMATGEYEHMLTLTHAIYSSPISRGLTPTP